MKLVGPFSCIPGILYRKLAHLLCTFICRHHPCTISSLWLKPALENQEVLANASTHSHSESDLSVRVEPHHRWRFGIQVVFDVSHHGFLGDGAFWHRKHRRNGSARQDLLVEANLQVRLNNLQVAILLDVATVDDVSNEKSGKTLEKVKRNKPK